MPHYSSHHHARLHLNQKTEKKFLNRTVLILAVVEPILTFPQIYLVWIKHQTDGLSVTTWSLLAVAAFIWLLYSLQIKSKPLIISNALWLAVELAVVVGVLIYG